MNDKKTRWSTDEKIRIVLQTFNPETKVAELCREHNLAPRNPVHVEGEVPAWRQRILGKPKFGQDAQEACAGGGDPEEDHR